MVIVDRNVNRIDINNITPLEALNILQRLKGMANG